MDQVRRSIDQALDLGNVIGGARESAAAVCHFLLQHRTHLPYGTQIEVFSEISGCCMILLRGDRILSVDIRISGDGRMYDLIMLDNSSARNAIDDLSPIADAIHALSENANEHLRRTSVA